MTDIEHRLRAAMHTAVDGEEAPPDLLSLVMRRHRRHAALVTGVTMLVVIGIGAVPAGMALRGEGARSVTRPQSSASPALGSRSPAHSPTPTPTPKPRHRAPSKLRGLPMPTGSNVRLLLAGARPVLFSMTSRTAEPIAGLPATKTTYVFTRVIGGWSAQPYAAAPQCLPACAGPPLPNYFIADGSLVATRIGLGFAVSASDRDGAVWLATFRRSTDHIETVPARAQLVSIAGKPIGPRYSLPPGYLIERAVGRYLLLAAMSQPGTPTYQLWDPRTRRVVRGVDNIIAAGPDQIAWSQACASCSVHVLTVSTGTSATIPVAPGTWAYNGTFSSDGRFLAVQLSAGVTPDGRATQERVGVIDLASRALTAIPGSVVSVDKSLSFGWQADSHRLIVALPESGDSIQIAYWQPGDAHLLVATAQLPVGMSPVLGESG
jgi:hypothetical protein